MATAIFRIITVVIIILSLNLKPGVAETVQARSADDFVESMGITTKFGFCPSRYCDRYPEVKALLADLGIRYIRDIPFPEPWRIRKDLYTDYGIQMLAEMFRATEEPLDPDSIPQRLDSVKAWGEMIMGIVGANEYDNPTFQVCDRQNQCLHGWSPTNWSENYYQFQQRLYREVKADPQLQDLPVVMGPMAHLDNLKQVSSLSGICDRGNDHPYPGAWGLPSQESGGGTRNSVRSLDKVVAKVQKVCPEQPLWITETGYEEASPEELNKYTVTQRAKAKYLPRLYASYFSQEGIEKTFLFELLTATEPATKFGIIDPDLQPTPAYYALKNLIALLEEASWNKNNKTWEFPDFQPDTLKYSLTGDLKNLNHLLLQKSNGTFYLLLWQEVYVYDFQRQANIINPESTIRLTVDGATIEQAARYLLYNPQNPAEELAPLQYWQNVSELSVSVPDDILVLEFSLKK